MAVYKIFPEKDATLYSLYEEMNTGLDEILEASLVVGDLGKPAPQASRFLIQFFTSEINDVINNKISSSTWQSNLRCFVANEDGLNLDTTIKVFPVSGSWNMGTGKFANSPETQNGCSWIWRDYQGSNRWATSSFVAGSTGSYSTSSDAGGGTWYISGSYSGSQTFGYWSDKDININVTNVVSAWYSGSIPNNGFILKQDVEFVDDLNVQPKLKYFSVDTHTIYPPCLEFKWVDFTWNTGSSTQTIISTIPATISVAENPGIFYPSSINKFRVNARPTYPNRVFSTSSYFTNNYYLPTSSYYAVKDLATNEYVIDFDTQYTKLSADETSSYFNLDMSGFETERYYEIFIKTTINGSTFEFNDNFYFKIVNG